MSSELSVKEFSYNSHFLFSHNSYAHCASFPFCRIQFKRPNAPDHADRSPSTTVVFISDSLYLKEEGDLQTEERGGMIMGLYIGVGVGVTWYWCKWVAWWHDDVSSSLDGRSSLHDLDHLYGYSIPFLIRQFGRFPSNVYKGILDCVGRVLNNLYEPTFTGGRWRQTVHGVDAHIKSFIYLELEMNLSCGCLLCCYIFRLFRFFPICIHLSTLCYFNSGEVYY